jgi:hypothetical protein
MTKRLTLEQRKKNKTKYERKYYLDNRERLLQHDKIYRQKNRALIYLTKIKRLFGVSKEHFEMLWNLQNGRCAICDLEFCLEKRNWTVDHNHITGKVRNLLCNPCNKFIGFARENCQILTNAIGYLNKHNESQQ